MIIPRSLNKPIRSISFVAIVNVESSLFETGPINNSLVFLVLIFE
jgi:hypothetical protein